MTDAQDGKGKVSVGKRKAAPKKGGKTGAGQEKEVEDVPVDPDEPRYCICGDVSWGTMVACENGEVSSVFCEEMKMGLTAVLVRERMVPPRLRRSQGTA